MDTPRVRDIGLEIGSLPPGKENTLNDLSHVQIGHTSLIKEVKTEGEKRSVRTGITAIFPHEKNLYLQKARAAINIINGYGKAIGIPQVRELGVIETPILLTNTLNVWRVADTLVTYMIEKTDKEIHSINPIVGECNDSYLNDIQGRHVTRDHVWRALKSAGKDNREGVVGAGVGMSAFGLKGGIGMASRVLTIEGREYTLGVLVLSNFGKLKHLRIKGIPMGEKLEDKEELNTSRENGAGSIMVVLGSNAPFSYRQLNRILNRVPHGLARTGSISHHGSGDFAIGFLSQPEPGKIQEKDLSSFFQATIECVEEAVLNSLFKAETIVGRKGHKREAIPIEKTRQILKYHRIIK